MKYDKTPGWFNSKDFYFNKIVEENFDSIKKECDFLIENNLFYPHSQSSENKKTDPNYIIANKWNVFDLALHTKPREAARTHAPFTLDLLMSIPEIAQCTKGKIYFSMIPGHAKVAPHRSLLKLNERHRHQLCLEAVEGADAFIDVNEDRRTWQVRNIISFDDAFRHHVENNSPHTRIVLIYDSIELT